MEKDKTEKTIIDLGLTNRDAELFRRACALTSSQTTARGHIYLLLPDHKDLRWGLHHFGGCEPITDARAEKIITQMEKWQKGGD